MSMLFEWKKRIQKRPMNAKEKEKSRKENEKYEYLTM